MAYENLGVKFHKSNKYLLGAIVDYADGVLAKVKFFDDGTYAVTRDFLGDGSVVYGDTYQGGMVGSLDYSKIVACTISPYSSADQQRLYYSHNGGATFTAVDQADLLAEIQIFRAQSVYPRLIFSEFHQKFFLFMTTSNSFDWSMVLWTSSDGVSWQKQGQTSRHDVDIYSTLEYITEYGGVFISNNTTYNSLLMSTDGINWTVAYTGGSYTTRYSYIVPAEGYTDDFYIVGDDAYLYKYTAATTSIALVGDVVSYLYSQYGNYIAHMPGIRYEKTTGKFLVAVVDSFGAGTKGYYRVALDLSSSEELFWGASDDFSAVIPSYETPLQHQPVGGTYIGSSGFLTMDYNHSWNVGEELAAIAIHTGSDIADITGGAIYIYDDFWTNIIDGTVGLNRGDIIGGDAWVTVMPHPHPKFKEPTQYIPKVTTFYKPADLRVTQAATVGTPYKPPQCSSTSKTYYTNQVSLNTATPSSSTYNGTVLSTNYRFVTDEYTGTAYFLPTIPEGYSGVKYDPYKLF